MKLKASLTPELEFLKALNEMTQAKKAKVLSSSINKLTNFLNSNPKHRIHADYIIKSETKINEKNNNN